MDAQPQRRLIRLVRHVAHRRAVDAEREATAPLADAMGRLVVRDDLAPLHFLQDRIVQAQVRDELLQLAVLVLELLDPPQLADAQPAIRLLPAVERLLRYPHPTDDLGHRPCPSPPASAQTQSALPCTSASSCPSSLPAGFKGPENPHLAWIKNREDVKLRSAWCYDCQGMVQAQSLEFSAIPVHMTATLAANVLKLLLSKTETVVAYTVLLVLFDATENRVVDEGYLATSLSMQACTSSAGRDVHIPLLAPFAMRVGVSGPVAHPLTRKADDIPRTKAFMRNSRATLALQLLSTYSFPRRAIWRRRHTSLGLKPNQWVEGCIFFIYCKRGSRECGHGTVLVVG
jgi:hypothetical protein